MPCNSIWVVKGLQNGDFAVGGSDAKLRVFSRSNERMAAELVLKVFDYFMNYLRLLRKVLRILLFQRKVLRFLCEEIRWVI